MTVKPGQSLGQYQIIEQIGKGGMATVYRASQPSLSRQVAIKVLPEFFAEDPAFHERFRQEAMSIAKLRHPNVLTVFDSGEVDGVAFIVTELVDGGTLAARLGKPLPLDECIAIVTPVASALDYAHARGMIHRDVKPANILLTPDGTPILSDFGLARMTGSAGADAVTRLTIIGAALGTPEYMAPEQARNSEVGPAADVYALAVMLYEMLTGNVPYSGDSPLNVIMARLNDPLPLPRERNPSLSEAVQTVLLKGLAKEPANRYASAGEMVRALDAAGRVAAPVPTPASPAALASPSASTRSRTPMIIAVAAGVALVAAATWLAIWSRTSSPPMSGADPASSAPTAGALSVGTGTGVPGTSAANAAASSTGTPAVTLPPPGAAIPTIVPAPPGAAPAATTPKRLATAGDGLPPHGRLLYSLATSAAELAALAPPRPGDAIALKDGALEFTAGTDLGVGTKMPVEGIGDFVAVLRYVATDHRPALTFRFHVTPQNQGHAVRLPAYLHLAPPAAGARADGPQLCCQPFDLFVAPQAAGSLSLFGGPPPVSVAAGASEEQVIVVAATGPLIVVSAGGREIARVQDAAFGPGSMSLGVSKARGEPPATVRLTSLDLYEPPASVPMPPPSARAALPPHGALLYSIADHLSDFAQVPQQRPENTIAVKGTSLEITAGADVNLVAPLPVGGIADFVAVLRFAVTNLKPFLQFRFHRSPQGDHAVQIPAYLRLAPPAAGARAVGAHPCCQEFDVFVTPQAGASALLSGPQIRSVAAPANEERQVVLSVKGPLLVVYEDGQEIARASFDASRTGGMSLQVQARGHQVPAVLRLNALEIYEAAALPAAGGTFISNPRAHR